MINRNLVLFLGIPCCSRVSKPAPRAPLMQPPAVSWGFVYRNGQGLLEHSVYGFVQAYARVQQGWAGVGADQPFKVYMDYYHYYYIIINITVRTER